MMRIVTALAVGWLLMFWVDSAMAVFDGLLAWPTGIHLLSPIRSALGGILLLGAVPIWIAVGLSPRLPARVFLPPLLFLGWVVLGASPLSIWWLGKDWFQLLLGLAQLAVTGWTAWQVSALQLDARTLAFSSRSERPAVRAPRMLAWVGTFTLLGPPLVLGYAWVSADLLLRHHTDGYIVLQPDGLAATHRELRRDGKTLDLIGMIHLGDASRYRDLFEPIPSEGTLVLEEGVSDAEGLLSGGPVYDRVADRLGLSVQQPIGAMSALETRNADLDVARFSKETRELLAQVFRLYQAENMASAFLDYYLFMRRQPDVEAMGRAVYDDVIRLRNAHLLEVLHEELPAHSRLVVPWGAYHMPEIEQALVDEGFERVAERRVTLIPFPWAKGAGEP